MIWLLLNLKKTWLCKCKIKCQDQKKLSISKIKKLLSLFRFIVSQKSNNKANALSFLNSSSIDDISESIYNILYNEKLNLNFSKSQKTKLKKLSNQTQKVLKIYQNETFLSKDVTLKLFNKEVGLVRYF